jgi:mannosyltransferase
VGLRLWSPSPLWLDEAQTVVFARLPLSELHGALGRDGAPPLYYALLHVWMDALGTGVWAARSLSMLFSLASLPLAFLVARRLGGSRRHGYVTMLLLASNPWAVRYAGEARMYSMVVFLVLVGILAGDRLRRRPGPGPVAAVAAVTAALLLTHYWAIFLLATVGLVVLGRALRYPDERPVARRALIGLAGGGVAFLPWLPTFLHQSAHTGAPWASPPDIGSLAVLPLDWSGGDGPVGRTMAVFLFPLLLLAVFARRAPGGTVALGVRPGGVTGLLGLVTGGTLVVALVASIVGHGAYAGRYSAVVVPLVIMLVAFGILTLPRAAAVPVLGTLVGLGLLGSLTIVETPHTRAGLVADVLNAKARAGDLIVYCPDQLAPAVEARLQVRGLNRITLPRQKDPRVIDWVDYTQRLESTPPRIVAEKVTAYVQSNTDAAVWYIFGANYRTHEAVCGPLRTRLVASLGLPQLMSPRIGRGWEKAGLERFAR